MGKINKIILLVFLFVLISSFAYASYKEQLLSTAKVYHFPARPDRYGAFGIPNKIYIYGNLSNELELEILNHELGHYCQWINHDKYYNLFYHKGLFNNCMSMIQ